MYVRSPEIIWSIAATLSFHLTKLKWGNFSMNPELTAVALNYRWLSFYFTVNSEFEKGKESKKDGVLIFDKVKVKVLSGDVLSVMSLVDVSGDVNRYQVSVMMPAGVSGDVSRCQ